jgi:hypothetical protein
MRALLVFVLASLPYVALAQEVNQVSAEGRGRYSITMNASGSLSILLDTTTGKTWRIFIEEDKSLAWRPVPLEPSPPSR